MNKSRDKSFFNLTRFFPVTVSKFIQRGYIVFQLMHHPTTVYEHTLMYTHIGSHASFDYVPCFVNDFTGHPVSSLFLLMDNHCTFKYSWIE